jgi:hypothetical protein
VLTALWGGEEKVVEILKNSNAIVVVYPAPEESRKAAYGSMKSTLTGAVGDLVSPLEADAWEALR